MSSIADSNAQLIIGRVWTQHQAVLTLIKDRLDNPQIKAFKWLDLACGRGQILSNLEKVLSKDSYSKIKYYGFDIIQEHCLQAEKLAGNLFDDVKVEVCEIDKFEYYLDEGETFDVITFTNTLHEITPEQIANTFMAVLCRVSSDGFVFMYDMESLPELELGAIPWRGIEIEQVLHCLLQKAGENAYLPSVATWPHKTCNGWHIHLNRHHLTVSRETLISNRDLIQLEVALRIREILEKKLLDTHQQLSVLSRYGAEAAQEELEIKRLTFDYWAISRVSSPHLLSHSDGEFFLVFHS